MHIHINSNSHQKINLIVHIIEWDKNRCSFEYGLAQKDIRANTGRECRREDSGKPDHTHIYLVICFNTSTRTQRGTHTTFSTTGTSWNISSQHTSYCAVYTLHYSLNHVRHHYTINDSNALHFKSQVVIQLSVDLCRNIWQSDQLISNKKTPDTVLLFIWHTGKTGGEWYFTHCSLVYCTM